MPADAMARGSTSETLRRQLAAVERLAQVGFWEWTIETDDVVWSDELYRIFGLEPGALVPTYATWLEAIHPEDREEADRLVTRAYETHASYAFDHRIVRPDGLIRVLHGRGNVELDDAGRPVRILGITSDVTEARREESWLRDFVSDVAHELRTPLTALQASVDLLRGNREDLPTVARDATMTVLSRQVVRLRTLANSLLDIDALRPDAGKLMLEPVTVEAAVSAAVLATPRPASALLTIDVDPRLRVRAAAGHVERILGALLANAYAYGGDAVSIVVSATEFDVVLKVEDDGAGVADELVGRLFQPFSRGRDAATVGSGLGLTLASKLAAGLGGSLHHQHRPEGGTCFALRLERLATDRGAS